MTPVPAGGPRSGRMGVRSRIAGPLLPTRPPRTIARRSRTTPLTFPKPGLDAAKNPNHALGGARGGRPDGPRSRPTTVRKRSRALARAPVSVPRGGPFKGGSRGASLGGCVAARCVRRAGRAVARAVGTSGAGAKGDATAPLPGRHSTVAPCRRPPSRSPVRTPHPLAPPSRSRLDAGPVVGRACSGVPALRGRERARVGRQEVSPTRPGCRHAQWATGPRSTR